MFGDTNTISQNEETKFNPMSIYALEKYRLFICVECIIKFMICITVEQFSTTMNLQEEPKNM